MDDESYELVTPEGARHMRFTLNRDAATRDDGLELLGLDHPLVQKELARWRRLPPEELGVSVNADIEEPALLSLWMIEASTGKGERRVMVQPIAVKPDGTRVPLVERQAERYLQAPASSPTILPQQRLELFARHIEPALQRELRHKGAVKGEGGYFAELIGYVEIGKRGA